MCLHALQGGVFELYRTIAPSYDWVLMNRSLWLYVSNWKDQPKASSKFRSPFARSTPVRVCTVLMPHRSQEAAALRELCKRAFPL